ncbi:MAG: chemotaxis protein CheW [Myxococcales bacterium]|nr:chemotaxis protein CheW [Myxococcales bacterium]
MIDEAAARAELAELRARLSVLEARLRTSADGDIMPEGAFDLLLCHVGAQSFSLALQTVEEVLPMAQLSTLPEAPDWVAGLLNLGGELIAVLDVGARLQRRGRRAEPSDRIVVCAHGARRMGLLVESVSVIATAGAGAVQEVDPDLPYASYVLGALEVAGLPTFLLGVGRLIAGSGLPETQPLVAHVEEGGSG